MPERYEREIEEIISKNGADIGPRTSLRQAFTDLQQRTQERLRKQTPSFLRFVTPRRVGTIGVCLLLAAFIAKTSYLAVLAIAVLMAAYLLSVMRGPETDSRWRGKPIELHPRPSLGTRLRQWFRGKPRRN